MERIVNDILLRYLLDRRLISKQQHGFIRRRSVGRGTLGILLFIAGRGRKAYWKRGVRGEGEGAEPI